MECSVDDLTDQDLYGPTGKPDASDIHQRLLGDCYFVAPLGALATQQPERIQNAIVYNPDTQAFTVTLYQHGHSGFLGLKDEAKAVQIEISQAEIAEAIAEPINQIVETALSALENAAPELAADIVDQGIVMTGGGALLDGIDAVLSAATGLPVIVADNALICVAMGAGRALEDANYRGVLVAI